MAKLGCAVLEVHHVGSTAVPGLCAKPILDALVLVAHFGDATKTVPDLRALGYEFRPEEEIPDRHYFRRPPGGHVRTHHLSLAEAQSRFTRVTLGFRDALRRDASLAASYANLKQDLAARFPFDRSAYLEGKSRFVSDVLASVGIRDGGDGSEHPRRDGKCSASQEAMTPASRSIRAEIVRDGTTCFVPVPFDPKATFGQVRAPVRVTLNGYTFRSTIAVMRGVTFIPLRKSHREAGGLEGGETLEVLIELDTEPRVVTPPDDLADALKASPPAWERWNEMSFTHQREHAEAITSARKPETRARRIEHAVDKIRSRPPRKS
jgi:GrpB-like predicted nucleotidyltransferase (UPF0157 family)